MCLSHLIYIVPPCLIHTCHAIPMPCSDHVVILKATAWPSRQPCCAVTLRIMAWAWHGMASVNQTWWHCVKGRERHAMCESALNTTNCSSVVMCSFVVYAIWNQLMMLSNTSLIGANFPVDLHWFLVILSLTRMTRRIEELILCHCCMKNRSDIGSACCPQISYHFLSCPQNARNNHESQFRQWGLPTSSCSLSSLVS
jgi:hypothetical protein